MSRIGLWFYRNEGGEGVLRQLQAALRDLGHEPCCDFDLRRCYTRGGRVFTDNGEELSALDCIYYMNADEQSDHQRDMLRALELAGVPLVNAFGSFESAEDKFIANTRLRTAGVRVPDAALMPATVPRVLLDRLFAEWGAVVVKARRGHGGRGVQRFDDADRLFDFIHATAAFHSGFYLEQFLPFGDCDTRVELIDGEYVGGYGRRRQHYFKTNVHAGATMVPVVPSDEAIETAKQAARALGIACTIIDMVVHQGDGEVYVLEVNPLLGVFTAAGLLAGINTVQTGADLHPVYAYDDRKVAMLAGFLDRVATPSARRRCALAARTP